ncbi:hypothetical protein [Agromyces ramosus]|uniref:Type II toxin-antitoxin system RelE/ParE family toxin n=1 Tax=Agromyces ramosus TaxID=33879 RepID=A0ABU0REV6_9MICO|nr:hypothetical protein [Agromyces ramosus]MDQ0895781.1 hypothetical protein [Agromyces ramosus]
MRLALCALKGFEGDLRALPSVALQKKTLELLSFIADGKLAGQPLDERVATGDLSDCRKVYFDEDPRATNPNYRLVYRLLPDEVHVVAVEAVAVGERFELDAYLRAAHNLGR